MAREDSGLPQWSEIAAVIRGAPCYTSPGRHRHKDGSEVPVEVCPPASSTRAGSTSSPSHVT